MPLGLILAASLNYTCKFIHGEQALFHICDRLNICAKAVTVCHNCPYICRVNSCVQKGLFRVL